MHSEDTARSAVLSRLTTRTDFGDCWRIVSGWLGGRYPEVHFSGRARRTHVVGWFLATGEWPKRGQHICHTCDDARCWKNDEIGTYEVDGFSYPRRGHLWLGTATANRRDCELKGRVPSAGNHWRTQKPERAAVGERHGQAILISDIVREMRARYASGEPINAIAKAYAVNHTVARCAVLRLTWKHVE